MESLLKTKNKYKVGDFVYIPLGAGWQAVYEVLSFEPAQMYRVKLIQIEEEIGVNNY